MATLQAATTSNGVTITDAQAVQGLCESYCFGTLDWEVDDNDRFSIWGYDAFEVYGRRENGLPDYEAGQRTHEFLRALAAYVEVGDELDIQTVGFTKCRFPVLAVRYVVRHGDVLRADLRTLEPIEDRTV
ncbi:hypothetical protein [Halorussus caseinilyticus]|uniref:Nuclear transport factor 2 family protein n=1 Tax=Halorussus caseinilyticus TaxID=3034025 RepID=A0ABD5WKA0_9EURY|nr:hypothetical protein [Halorussus sp. DT72]